MSMNFPPLRYFNLASFITSLSVVCGLIAIVVSAQGHFALACTALFLAILCDHFDGIVARRLNQSSKFGAELDSLADALSFCAAPALITWLIGFQYPLLIIVLPLYVLAGIWRLALFNLSGLDETGTTPCYVGLPTTNAAVWWLFMAAGLGALKLDATLSTTLWSAFFVVTAYLMVSSVRIPKRGLYVYLHMLGLPIAIALIWLSG